MGALRYRAVRHWRGPATVEADGRSYAIELEVVVVARTELDADGGEQQREQLTWSGEAFYLPRELDGEVIVCLDRSQPVPARARSGRLTGDQVPSLPVSARAFEESSGPAERESPGRDAVVDRTLTQRGVER